jgi:hypothetical protein
LVARFARHLCTRQNGHGCHQMPSDAGRRKPSLNHTLHHQPYS